MIVKQSAVVDFQRRELDSWLWMKGLTRERMLREIGTLKIKPHFKTEPWLHQLVCFWIALHRPDFLFLLDMGLGKTKILLDVMTQTLLEGKLKHALVTVPRKINIESWGEAVLEHSDLEPELVSCTDIEEKWERLSNPRGELTVIDLQSLQWALSEKASRGKKGGSTKYLRPDEKRVAIVQKLYNFVGIDESHKLANDQSLWFALMRRMTARTDFNYATTGTLFGSNVEAIWPQFFLVDRGETFGENKSLFRASFFHQKPNPFGRGEKYEHDSGTYQKMHSMLQHRSLRYDETEVLDLPKRTSRIERYTMTEEQRGHYLRAVNGVISAGGELQERHNAWVLMRRICSGYMTWNDPSLGELTAHFAQNPKLDGLESLVENCIAYSKVVICYDYTETGRMICQRLTEMGINHEWYYGGTKDKAGSRRRFIDDSKCRAFVMNSEAGGTGNDGLQKVARYMFLYESPTPPTTRKQTIKRIHRPGQDERTFIYDLTMRQSIDGTILEAHRVNEDVYASVVTGKRNKRDTGFFTKDFTGTLD